jgi:hypothetical protein
MARIHRLTKDPDDILNVQLDWSEWLASAETISTSTWIPESGITVPVSSTTTTITTGRVVGGTLGTTYKLVNRITTNQSEQKDQTILIEIREQ